MTGTVFGTAFRSSFRTGAQYLALGGAAVGLAYWLGAVTPMPSVRVTDDRLGPESGEPILEYLKSAADSVSAAPAQERRWALISPAMPWSTNQVWSALGGLDRIGRVLVRVPIERVQTPTLTVAPGQSAAGVAAVNSIAALKVPAAIAPGERGDAVGRVVVSRLRAGTPAVVGVVVYGTGDALRATTRKQGVRAVEVLPDRGSRFAVSPLLPSFGSVAEPGADDGPVPAP